MSTRGVVGLGTLHRWRGVYNHSDSYPTGLGRALYEHLGQAMLTGKTLEEIGRDILLFDDWRNYLNGGICDYCGKMTGQPHSISSALFGKRRGKYPDPKAKYHEHNSLEELDQLQYSERSVEDSDLDWVYVINPAVPAVHVLNLRGRRTEHVGDLRFDSVPNFEALECGEKFERCGHYAWLHFPEIDQKGPQARLGTKHYLGLVPLWEFEEAYAFERRGKRYRPTGSGLNGAYARSFGISVPDPNAWYERVTAEDGQKTYMAVARFGTRTRMPYRGVTWVFPPTLVQPKETFRGARSRKPHSA